MASADGAGAARLASQAHRIVALFAWAVAVRRVPGSLRACEEATTAARLARGRRREGVLRTAALLRGQRRVAGAERRLGGVACRGR